MHKFQCTVYIEEHFNVTQHAWKKMGGHFMFMQTYKVDAWITCNFQLNYWEYLWCCWTQYMNACSTHAQWMAVSASLAFMHCLTCFCFMLQGIILPSGTVLLSFDCLQQPCTLQKDWMLFLNGSLKQYHVFVTSLCLALPWELPCVGIIYHVSSLLCCVWIHTYSWICMSLTCLHFQCCISVSETNL